ncbi:hypothetical protein MSAN_01538100 [Mycena sanguinolenta]|uniref:Uncharacterized protein n=1 Tax=Mycena sanguinolenta TaxID=230812 RepID=A0A8H7CX20_9AGAR|nr:hypothetical protein MSAN_01538100 [Mycena sanguinolenta]
MRRRQAGPQGRVHTAGGQACESGREEGGVLQMLLKRICAVRVRARRGLHGAVRMDAGTGKGTLRAIRAEEQIHDDDEDDSPPGVPFAMPVPRFVTSTIHRRPRTRTRTSASDDILDAALNPALELQTEPRCPGAHFRLKLERARSSSPHPSPRVPQLQAVSARGGGYESSSVVITWQSYSPIRCASSPRAHDPRCTRDDCEVDIA